MQDERTRQQILLSIHYWTVPLVVVLMVLFQQDDAIEYVLKCFYN